MVGLLYLTRRCPPRHSKQHLRRAQESVQPCLLFFLSLALCLSLHPRALSSLSLALPPSLTRVINLSLSTPLPSILSLAPSLCHPVHICMYYLFRFSICTFTVSIERIATDLSRAHARLHSYIKIVLSCDHAHQRTHCSGPKQPCRIPHFLPASCVSLYECCNVRRY